MSQNFTCFLTFLLLIKITLADIYDNCGGNGENCLIQNKGNKPDPDSGSGDCLAEKVSFLNSKHTYISVMPVVKGGQTCPLGWNRVT